MKPLLLPRMELPGNDAATAAIDDLLHKIESLSDWSVGGLVRKDGTPGTRNYRIDSDGRLFAKLSGTTSPYTATPVYPAASGAWANYPTGSLSGVYEANGVAGLNDKVVRVWPTTDGGWRFVFSRAGSSGGVDCSLDPTYDDGTLWCTGCAPIPLPKRIHMTVASTTISIGSASRGQWFGNHSYSGSGCAGTGPCTVHFGFGCIAGPTWNLEVEVQASNIGVLYCDSITGGDAFRAQVPLTGDPTTRPLYAIGTIPAVLTDIFYPHYTINISAFCSGTIVFSE